LKLIKKYWFMLGLLAVLGITLADRSGIIGQAGIRLRMMHGPAFVIFIIFFISGTLLDTRRIVSGLTDISGTAVSMLLIFIAAPLLAVLPGLMPLDTGLKMGIFLVAVMPTTLSSGIVMAGAAGGNMAHALVISILANVLSVFTIPFSLSLLLEMAGNSVPVVIDKTAIMIKLAALVLLPLCMGLGIRHYRKNMSASMEKKLQTVNQLLILLIVWMAVSQTKSAMMQGAGMIGIICLLAFFYHGAMLLFAGALIRIFRIPRGRMESLLFMGGQKTLTLSVILQVSLFPDYGIALVFCVMHHIIHLFMDAWLVGKLQISG
jgi:sodium/bile acid cotransporter 7